MVCGSNLSGIGRAMLIYANDYDNQFPRAGGRDTIWQPKINNWKADNRFDAFGLKRDGTGGSATISSSLYLLIRFAKSRQSPLSATRTQEAPSSSLLNTEYVIKNLKTFGTSVQSPQNTAVSLIICVMAPIL